MTLEEIYKAFEEQEPLEFLMICFQLLRTIEQGEPATIEGCCASMNAWIDKYGKPSHESINLYLKDLGKVAQLDIDDRCIAYAINCED